MKYILFHLFIVIVIYFSDAFAIQHPTNLLYNRQVIDKLSGFRNCTDYDYPIKLTELSFVPYPIVIGKWFFAKSTGINKVAIIFIFLQW